MVCKFQSECPALVRAGLYIWRREQQLIVVYLLSQYEACTIRVYDQGQIQDLIRGAPDRDRPKLLTVRSSIVQVKRDLFSMGSGACLRALEALGYFITKYAFSPFWGTFVYYF